MSISEKVKAQVMSMKFHEPFPISYFYALGCRSSVQNAMNRLLKEEVVERVSKGFYARPKYLESLPSIKYTTSAEQLARAWAKKHGYLLVSQGFEASYNLGFQTQAPMRVVFWSNGPSRNFKIGNGIVEVRHITEKKLRWPNKPEGELLRGLLENPPNFTKPQTILEAFKRLSLSDKDAIKVLHKLMTTPLLKAWKPKLQETEKILTEK